MNLPQISSYEVKTSRTEQKVPVVNGVHLHSIYNPFKEAENLVESHLDALKHKNEVLVLGLGFAYHVNYIIEKMTEFHGNNFKLIVIEPNVQVHQDCEAFDLVNKKNILIYSGFSPVELYSDIELIHFLLRKPAMIAHPASFNLYQYYYKSFLTFEAPTLIGEISTFLETTEIKNYLKSFDASLSFKEAIFSNLPQKSVLSSMDFLSMTLVEMTKGSLVQDKGDRDL